MPHADLIESLQALGLGEHDMRATLVMPLIRVAWADTQVQPKEKATILAFADKAGLTPDGRRAVERWLENDPGLEAMQRAQEVLRELARLQFVSLQEMDEVVSLAQEVAKAAGGVFGMFSIDTREKEVLRDIEGNLSATAIDFTAGSWDEELALS